MLQVATSDIIVGPTRLLFPRAPGGVGEAADFPYSLLGLGDIAIPGRVDHCSSKPNARGGVEGRSLPVLFSS
jgi:minor histocompatibility antigen H13